MHTLTHIKRTKTGLYCTHTTRGTSSVSPVWFLSGNQLYYSWQVHSKLLQCCVYLRQNTSKPTFSEKKKNLISVLPSILPQSKIFYTQTLLIRRVSLIQAPHSVKIYFLDTVESLVRDHPKCEELVVADERRSQMDARLQD